MNIKTVLLAIITIATPLLANATVKPTIPALMSYSTLVAKATINTIEEPYANQKVITLNVIDVLDGEINGPDVILTVLDNTIINKGIHDFKAFQADGMPRVYFLKYVNGEYNLSDSWFGIEIADSQVINTISEYKKKER